MKKGVIFEQEIDMIGIAEAIDNTQAMNFVMKIGNLGVQGLTGESRYSNLIGELNRIGRLGGVKQAALITRDGLLINDIPEKTCTCISAAMMAASLGAAEIAFAEIRKGIPDKMVLSMSGERIIVKSAGPKMLLTAIIDDKVDDNIIMPVIEKTAELIKSMS